MTLLAIFLTMVGAADLVRREADDVALSTRVAAVAAAALLAILGLWGAGFGWHGSWLGPVGAIVAAKGILRFPEISRDDPEGNKAEYVLVGSFVSWLLALVFVPLF